MSLGPEGRLSALHARKGQDYLCPECQETLRLRSGPHRQPHFYHLKVPKECRQHGKSAEHMHAQLRLLSLLPKGEALMEHPFPSINRIADLFWEPKRIVFEIQCSPISLMEIEKRCTDYRSLGLEIVWLLHDHQFNKLKRSAAEHFLDLHPHYFTNISSQGEGIFYDQFEICQGFSRKFKGPPLPIFLHEPRPPPPLSSPVPQALRTRAENWKLCFQGDFSHRFSQQKEPSHLLAIEERYSSPPSRPPLLARIKLRYARWIASLLRTISE